MGGSLGIVVGSYVINEPCTPKRTRSKRNNQQTLLQTQGDILLGGGGGGGDGVGVRGGGEKIGRPIAISTVSLTLRDTASIAISTVSLTLRDTASSFASMEADNTTRMPTHC